METVKEKCQVNGPSHKPVMKFHANWIEKEKATKIMSEDSNHYSIIV
jgi:hypothetical protein